jgi:hypothetical protein
LGRRPRFGARPCPFYHDPHTFRSHERRPVPQRAPAGGATPAGIGQGDPQSPFGDPFGDALDAAFGGSPGADTLDAVGTLPAEQPDAEAGLRTELSLWALVFAAASARASGR